MVAREPIRASSSALGSSGKTTRRSGSSKAEASRLEQRVLRVCDAVGAFIEYWGFKAILGKVWCYLALRAEPTSQARLAQALGVSRSLISGAITELLSYGLVRPVSDHRRAPYEAVIDVWPAISDVLRSREWQLLEDARQALESALEEAEVVRSQGRPLPYSTGRMRFLLAMTDMAQRFLRMLITLRTASVADGVASWVTKASSLFRQRFNDFLGDRS